MCEDTKDIHIISESGEKPPKDVLALIYNTIQKLNQELNGEITITDVKLRFTKPVTKYSFDITVDKE